MIILGIEVTALGVLGGMAGILGTLFSLMLVGTKVALFKTESVLILGIFGLIFSISGLIGGLAAPQRPVPSGIAMIVSAIGGLIMVSWGYIISTPLLLIAGFLALFGTKEKEEKTEKMD